MPVVFKVADNGVSTHSRPKAAGSFLIQANHQLTVSTHSRPKAAGILVLRLRRFTRGFNTQPPEGGWEQSPSAQAERDGFNTQPPEGCLVVL